MKITREYLKKVIKEELNRINEQEEAAEALYGRANTIYDYLKEKYGDEVQLRQQITDKRIGLPQSELVISSDVVRREGPQFVKQIESMANQRTNYPQNDTYFSFDVFSTSTTDKDGSVKLYFKPYDFTKTNINFAPSARFKDWKPGTRVRDILTFIK